MHTVCVDKGLATHRLFPVLCVRRPSCAEPTWDEPSKGVSLSDNGGSLYIDLYVFQADWVSILVT